MTVCPGCGLVLPEAGVLGSPRYNASAECWGLFGELTAYQLSIDDPTFAHQLAVDTYGAQHSGGKTRSITTAYALIGLYLAIEKGWTGILVQRAHMALARRSMAWPRLNPPGKAGLLTVQDVLLAALGDERDAMLRKWAEDVWLAWEKAHEWARDISRDLLEMDN